MKDQKIQNFVEQI